MGWAEVPTLFLLVCEGKGGRGRRVVGCSNGGGGLVSITI